ncbi:hypothetical protein HWV07_17145 [Natronomonas salina]|uniref:DUF5305 family protein n=1 Tax=Natronomonas salina TaxID=1710540 RepID=UPI0015B66522|nr:DUF5305 family protein [Natronomonas salina]QLD90674.1 hypothetical protein HWV07_17145 [Natronomonas salina]
MLPDGLEASADRRAGDDPSALDRARVRLDDHLPVVLTALLVVALVGGWLTFAAYAAPVTEERVAGSVDGEGGYDYGATVQRDNPVYPVGTRLDDRRNFVVRMAPELNGTYTHDYRATDVEDVAVETTLSLQLRSVDGGDVYWETSERLATEGVEGPAGTVVVPFSLDVEALSERVEEIEGEVGGTPGTVEATLLARTHTTGMVDEQPVAGVETTRLPLDAKGNTYTVLDEEHTAESRPVLVKHRTVRGSGDPLGAVGGPLALVAGLGGLAALAVGRLLGRVSPPDHVRRRVLERRTRDELDEWITRGRVPGELRTGPLVEADTLGGLVDVAIDGDERVIEDVGDGSYYVIDGGTVYVFRPTGSWVSASEQGEASVRD